jgi:hypothetical protein
MCDDEIEYIYKKGDALVLEDENCEAQYLYADQLRYIVYNSGAHLDFVFMANCHSEFAARIFLQAGAHHVIGINKDRKISDETVLTFTHTFYTKLWKERSRIC